MLAGSRFAVGGVDAEKRPEYALKQSFDIGTADAQVTDALVNTIAAGNKTTVDVYVFYDGSAKTVYSDNLANLKNCGVTVTFTATPVNTDGNAVNCANNAVTNTTVQP